MNDSVCVIANPAAGRGRAARVLPRLREAAARVGVTDVRVTRAPGDERVLARDAAAQGVGTIVALGGDGTWGKVAQGIVESGRSPRLAIVSGGTGNDLAFSTGVPAHDVEAAMRIATGTGERAVDVGLANDIAFLNVVGFGFEATVLRTAMRLHWLRGHAVYVAAALRHLFTYNGLAASYTLASDPRFRGGDGAPSAPSDPCPYLAIVVSNGPRFGGGFLIAPDATVSDGALDVVAIRDTNPLRRALLFSQAMSGRHIGAAEVRHARAPSLSIHFDAPPLFDVDGDLVQAATNELRISCLPGRLRLAV